jgi:3-methyl-2-oxobutanoate hydroxymethyltransferase
MKKTAQDIKAMKGKEKISVLTCYDYSFAKAVSDDVDILLVGDSLGNVILGYERTRKVEMSDVLRHIEAVRRGAPNTFIVADLPYGSYNNKGDAIENAKKLIEYGADAVKPEGKPEIVKTLVQEGIEVMGHVGLLPQSAEKLGVVREDQNEIINQAKEIVKAGAFTVVVESVPKKLAKIITDHIDIPTIGIGAGKECDGQVLVLYDMIGLYPDFEPKFVRKYLNLKEEVKKAVKAYSEDVKKGDFPSDEESFD